MEEIKLADEDMDRGFKRIGDMYNMTVAKVKEYFQNREDLMPLMHELLNEKILGYLREQAVLVAPAQTETTTENDGAES